MFLISFGFSLFLILIVLAVAWLFKSLKAGASVAFCLLMVMAILFGMGRILLPAFLLSGCITAAAAWSIAEKKGGVREFLKVATGGLILTHCIVAVYSLWVISERSELRTLYPAESLSERLAYEDSPLSLQGNESLTVLSKEGDFDLFRFEQRTRGSRRANSLGSLHESVVDDFIESPGFGVGRMIDPPTKRTVILPEAESITLPLPRTTGFSNTSSAHALPAETLREMHWDSVVDFVNTKGFGVVKDRDHVKGFQAHHFHEMPKFRASPATTQRWSVERLELVSLLKHREPAIYISKHLPRMDELRHVETRALDDFEKQTLAALRRGENLVVDSASDQIRMLGAIRAGERCLDCHRGERGRLLGAFSYTLVPDLGGN
jgi:hypothetical protein